jgi:hypothetical protein
MLGGRRRLSWVLCWRGELWGLGLLRLLLSAETQLPRKCVVHFLCIFNISYGIPSTE